MIKEQHKLYARLELTGRAERVITVISLQSGLSGDLIVSRLINDSVEILLKRLDIDENSSLQEVWDALRKVDMEASDVR
jgi:hypothetical protein